MAQIENLIVGGGLAGLMLARLLHQSGQSFTLLEARDRLGGRIVGHNFNDATFDLGPAWFWPGQPRIANLIDVLGLEWFEQFSGGLAVYEDEHTNRQTAQGFASMAGSFRLSGGFNALVNALARGLPMDRIHTGQTVSNLEFDGKQITAKTRDLLLTAEKVVLALPPRIASTLMAFQPRIPTKTLTEVPTWMAGHAKAIAIYNIPFWRGAGLSGDAISGFGPLMEIHDASPTNNRLGALFGFFGTPTESRKDSHAMRQAVIDQLTRLFGPQAAQPIDLVMKDWAFDPLTATIHDHAPLYAHPNYAMPPALTGLYDNRLFFASTEMASEFGGYLEGALAAAEDTFDALNVGR